MLYSSEFINTFFYYYLFGWMDSFGKDKHSAPTHADKNTNSVIARTPLSHRKDKEFTKIKTRMRMLMMDSIIVVVVVVNKRPSF